jgi:hypothetical protein
MNGLKINLFDIMKVAYPNVKKSAEIGLMSLAWTAYLVGIRNRS